MWRQQRDLSVEVVFSTVVTERGVPTSSSSADPRSVTWTVGELEVVPERAGLL